MAIHENFYEAITTRNKVLGCYNKLYFTHDNVNIYTSNESINSTNTTINISLFPSYLQPGFNNTNDIEVVKIPQKKIVGYAVLIKEYSNIETLFKTEYKKNFRANILRFVNRFEDCFNANYKLFFGDISKEDYTFLMDTLQSMLTCRFEQRNDSNKVLKNWQAYLNTTYHLIKEKKASLFVIYENDIPVHICLNHHFNNILFVSVPSYDINYSKFALGNVSLYKLLEWSVNNNYKMMDMAQGYLEYKRRWSNLIYEFDHHILYSNKSILRHFTGMFEVKKLHFKNFLKTKNIDTFVENTKKRFRKTKVYQEEFNYKLEESQMTNTNALIIIYKNNPIYNTLKKAINDFLYTHKEHSNDLKIFEITKNKEYLLEGKNISQKLTQF